MSVKIILGDTSPITKKVFTLSLDAQNYPLIFVEDEASLKEAVEKEKPQVVVISSNITSNLGELTREISSKYPSIKILVLKSPFERTELTETENIKIIMKPVPSSKIKEYIFSVEKSIKGEISEPIPGEEFPEEETHLPEEEELSEEELQATTWESHTSEEAFSDEDIFPEEEESPSRDVIFEEKIAGEEEEVELPQEEFIEEVVSPVEKVEEEIVMEKAEEKVEMEMKKEETPPAEEFVPLQQEESLELPRKEVKVEKQETPSEEVSAKEIPPEIIEKIAWEVIPPLAEKILREEIQKLIKKLEES